MLNKSIVLVCFVFLIIPFQSYADSKVIKVYGYDSQLRQEARANVNARRSMAPQVMSSAAALSGVNMMTMGLVLGLGLAPSTFGISIGVYAGVVSAVALGVGIYKLNRHFTKTDIVFKKSDEVADTLNSEGFKYRDWDDWKMEQAKIAANDICLKQPASEGKVYVLQGEPKIIEKYDPVEALSADDLKKRKFDVQKIPKDKAGDYQLTLKKGAKTFPNLSLGKFDCIESTLEDAKKLGQNSDTKLVAIQTSRLRKSEASDFLIRQKATNPQAEAAR